MAHGSEASGGVALTGVGPVRQQQHPDGLQVDVVHLFVSGHLDAAGQGPRALCVLCVLFVCVCMCVCVCVCVLCVLCVVCVCVF